MADKPSSKEINKSKTDTGTRGSYDPIRDSFDPVRESSRSSKTDARGQRIENNLKTLPTQELQEMKDDLPQFMKRKGYPIEDNAKAAMIKTWASEALSQREANAAEALKSSRDSFDPVREAGESRSSENSGR